jgi:hypothetical protein
MKKVLSLFPFLAAAFVAAFLLRPMAPAQPERSGAQAQGLEQRVAALESELMAEKKRHDETRALLEQTLAYLEKQAKGSEAMLGVLDASEQQGFTAGENFRSRETLLLGFRVYWGELQSGLPKVPAPPAAAPAAPARPARQ